MVLLKNFDNIKLEIIPFKKIEMMINNIKKFINEKEEYNTN
jgi:hypothetical protein